MAILLYVLVAGLYLGLAAWAWRTAFAGAAVRHPAHGGVQFAIDIPAGAGSGRTAVYEAAPASSAGTIIASDQRHALGGSAIGRGERAIWLAAWLAQLFLIRDGLLDGQGLRFGFAIALSATMWLAVAAIWIESLYYELASLRLLVLPLAALCALLPMWFPGGTVVDIDRDLRSVFPASSPAPSDSFAGGWKFEAHLVVALAAYSLLTLAALHALLMTALERWLHRHGGHDGFAEYSGGLSTGTAASTSATQTSAWSKTRDALFERLPPLLTLERLLFRLIAVGFLLLTLTVLSGVIFSEALFARPMRFDHKTVFTLVSWLIFAALLAGRRFRGWRGRVALRWTLAGFIALLLAYVGSRFVLEVVLHRF